MNRQEEIMPHSLLSLAGQIQSPDDVPAQCLREAAAMIESLVSERDMLLTAVRETLSDHADLADGEDCTLFKLKQASTFSFYG